MVDQVRKTNVPEHRQVGFSFWSVEEVVHVTGTTVVVNLFEISLTGRHSFLGFSIPGGVKLEEHPQSTNIGKFQILGRRSHIQVLLGHMDINNRFSPLLSRKRKRYTVVRKSSLYFSTRSFRHVYDCFTCPTIISSKLPY